MLLLVEVLILLFLFLQTLNDNKCYSLPLEESSALAERGSVRSFILHKYCTAGCCKATISVVEFWRRIVSVIQEPKLVNTIEFCRRTFTGMDSAIIRFEDTSKQARIAFFYCCWIVLWFAILEMIEFTPTQLKKKGRRRRCFSHSWTTRTFVLDGTHLKYYSGGTLRDSMNLLGTTTEMLEPQHADNKPFSFVVHLRGGEDLILSAADEETRAHCLEMFNAVSKGATSGTQTTTIILSANEANETMMVPPPSLNRLMVRELQTLTQKNSLKLRQKMKKAPISTK